MGCYFKNKNEYREDGTLKSRQAFFGDKFQRHEYYDFVSIENPIQILEYSVDGKQCIKRTNFYKHGKQIVKYIDGNQELWTKWGENGKLKHEKIFLNNKEHGKWLFYYDNGNIKLEENYLDGKKHGLFKEYYLNNILKSEKSYLNNEFHGNWIMWFDNGQIYIHRNYVSGKLDGFFKVWNEKGILIQNNRFKEDKWHGVSTWFNDNGGFEKATNFDNGIKLEKVWNYDGKLHFVKYKI